MSTVNEIWRIDSDWLMAYTEDRGTMRKIKRSYHDFIIVADYHKNGKFVGLQYKIPSRRKRAARYVFGVNVAR